MTHWHACTEVNPELLQARACSNKEWVVDVSMSIVSVSSTD